MNNYVLIDNDNKDNLCNDNTDFKEDELKDKKFHDCFFY